VSDDRVRSDLLASVAKRAASYLAGIAERNVAPTPDALSRLEGFRQPLPDAGVEPAQVISQLDETGSPATVTTTGGRYFGFVNGGTLPAALAANWLAGAWDQNGALVVMSPVAAALEEVALGWLLDVLGLPGGAGCGFVSGATMANFTCLAAARHALLAAQGWDVEERGLFGAPPVTVVVGAEVHASMRKALALVGFGRERVLTVPTDAEGRMRADAFPAISGPAVVCIQAGNVNTGSFDPAREICDRAHAAGAWVHVDGAFGLWAAASPASAHLVDGVGHADSWATDAHKWLNVPYDSGLAFVRDPAHLRAAMAISAAYLQAGDTREPAQYTPEASRHARGVEIWAALLSLGRSGLADLIERTCRHARRFAAGLAAAGYEVLNEVVLNQVLVSFGDSDTTRRVIAGIQADGTCWCGGTVWQGKTAMRISVSCWATTGDDVERSLEAMLRIATKARAGLNH
jgi:glutamate/tyrosine decarboxylase-like PLP-dependent enzyme